jgi:hypothetical protein
MVTDADYQRLRDKVYKLQAQVDFLYQHLGVTYVPQPVLDDPRIVAAIKKGDLLGAIKVHREIFSTDLETAREAVLEIKGRLGI